MLMGEIEREPTDSERPMTENDESLRIYIWLSESASIRLTVGTFLAGFTLAAFVALFGAGQTLDTITSGTIVLLLADVFLGVATLLFLVNTTATYVAMQRVATMSAQAMRTMETDQPQFSATDHIALREAEKIYLEPGTYIVWGLLLIVVSLLLIAWHIHPVLSGVLFVIFVALMLRVRTLRTVLARVMLSPHFNPWNDR